MQPIQQSAIWMQILGQKLAADRPQTQGEIHLEAILATVNHRPLRHYVQGLWNKPNVLARITSGPHELSLAAQLWLAVRLVRDNPTVQPGERDLSVVVTVLMGMRTLVYQCARIRKMGHITKAARTVSKPQKKKARRKRPTGHFRVVGCSARISEEPILIEHAECRRTHAMTVRLKTYAQRVAEFSERRRRTRDELEDRLDAAPLMVEKDSGKSESSQRSMYYWIVTACLLPGAWLWMAGYSDAPVVTHMGTVERVRFVGGLAPRTEVQTTTHTVLLHGAVELANGEVITRRVGAFDANELCVTRTKQCFEILSR